MKKTFSMMICAAATLLSACGGGGDSGSSTPAPTTAVPASVSESVTGLVSYLMALVGSSADTLEPVDVSGVTPATSDTTEPAVID